MSKYSFPSQTPFAPLSINLLNLASFCYPFVIDAVEQGLVLGIPCSNIIYKGASGDHI